MSKKASLLLVAIVVTVSVFVIAFIAFAADRGPWAPNVAYAVNDTVTYNGVVYKCLQAHTSQVGWEPPNAPALWGVVGTPTPGGGATATPTKTNTSTGPTNTPTRTPTRTNTPTGPTNTPTATFIAGDLGYGTVHGTVTNVNTGAPIVGALVTCSHFSYNPRSLCSGTRTTGSDGAYVFSNVFFHDTDRITVNVQASGYISQTIQQTSFTVANMTANFALASGAATSTPTRTNTPTGPTNTPTRTPTSSAGCWTPWVSTTAYNGGAQVSYNGQKYQAAFWTQGDQPDTHSGPPGSGQPWIPMGAC